MKGKLLNRERNEKGLFEKGCTPGPGRPRGPSKKPPINVERELARHTRAWRRQFGEYFDELPSTVNSLLIVAEEQLRRILLLKTKENLSVNEHKLLNSSANSLRQTLSGATVLIQREMKLIKEAEHAN
ncbi:MAG: hypothetical protein GTN76_08910 [Candidatus Aenigmarchaeota archaeon]|nr:hypothetical protein [Candidatus Aenigmarchaeota archaeon]